MRRSRRMPRTTGSHRVVGEVSPPPDSAQAAPKLPHERDETPDATEGVDRVPVARAAADIVAGREDTDCYGAAHSTFRRVHTRRSK